MGHVTAGLVVALVIVLLWSLGAKLADLARGRTDLLEVLPGPRRLRHALLVAVLVTEAGTAVALLLSPARGLWLAACVFLAFTLWAWRLPEGRPCRCFGAALEFGSTRLGRVVRNATLGVLAVTAALAAGAGPLPALSLQAVALGTMIVALVASADLLTRTLNSGQLAGRR